MLQLIAITRNIILGTLMGLALFACQKPDDNPTPALVTPNTVVGPTSININGIDITGAWNLDSHRVNTINLLDSSIVFDDNHSHVGAFEDGNGRFFTQDSLFHSVESTGMIVAGSIPFGEYTVINNDTLHITGLSGVVNNIEVVHIDQSNFIYRRHNHNPNGQFPNFDEVHTIYLSR